jgi:hypothetical protein
MIEGAIIAAEIETKDEVSNITSRELVSMVLTCVL